MTEDQYNKKLIKTFNAILSKWSKSFVGIEAFLQVYRETKDNHINEIYSVKVYALRINTYGNIKSIEKNYEIKQIEGIVHSYLIDNNPIPLFGFLKGVWLQ